MTEFTDHIREINFPDPLPQVRCSGGSLWMESKGQVGLVKSIKVRSTEFGEDDYYVIVDVRHTIPHWEIYTDKGFEDEVSKILSDAIGFRVFVGFTEQGMQTTYIASMEPRDDDSAFILDQFARFVG